MSSLCSEMNIVENLLKAIDEGGEKVDSLCLSPGELDRYYGCLLMARILKSTRSGSEGCRLTPTSRGSALLNLIRDLDKISEADKTAAGAIAAENPVDFPGWFLENYALQEADIDRIRTRLVN